MNDLLVKYIIEVIEEMQDYRVPNQLIGNRASEEKSKKDKDDDSVDEMNVVANIAGFTAPLGASNIDMGRHPVKPGGKVKKRKKSFVRWK